MQLIQLLVRHLLIGRNRVAPRPEFVAQKIRQLGVNTTWYCTPMSRGSGDYDPVMLRAP
jgi:hypothetical protein